MQTVVLSQAEKEALQKLSKNASTRSAVSLSSLINQEVVIDDILVREISPDKLTDIDEAEHISSIVTMSLVGELTGYISLITTEESSLNLADLASNKPLGTTKKLDATKFSVLKEIGNIIGSSFLTSIANASDLSITSSPPSLTIGILSEAIMPIVKAFNQKEGTALVFHLAYKMAAGSRGDAENIVPQISITSRFVLVLDVDSLKKLLGSIQE
jgi:chemotaxis protein CheC